MNLYPCVPCFKRVPVHGGSVLSCLLVCMFISSPLFVRVTYYVCCCCNLMMSVLGTTKHSQWHLTIKLYCMVFRPTQWDSIHCTTWSRGRGEGEDGRGWWRGGGCGGQGLGGGGLGGGGETDDGIMEEIKLYYIALYSDPPIEIMPTVQLRSDTEGKERMEEEGEEEGVGGGGGETDGGIIEWIKLYYMVFRPTQWDSVHCAPWSWGGGGWGKGGGGQRWWGREVGGGGKTDGGIMEQIKLYCIALYSGPPSEILPNVDLGAEAEEKERAEEDREEEVAGEETDGGIMEQEEKEKGVVKLAVYSAYWKAVGSCLSPLVLLSLFLMQGLIMIIITDY